MVVLLGGVAKMSPGYPFRGRLDEAERGNVRVLQLKDTFDSLFIDCSVATKVSVDNLKTQYLVREEDLVFRSRGGRNTASIISAVDGAVVCAAPLFQIRVTSPEVIPEYLCWYINQPSSQSFLDSHAQGTSVRMIGRDALEGLPVTVPPLELQKRIAAAAQLADREVRLMELLAEKKRIWISGLLMRVASENGKGSENGQSE